MSVAVAMKGVAMPELDSSTSRNAIASGQFMVAKLTNSIPLSFNDGALQKNAGALLPNGGSLLQTIVASLAIMVPVVPNDNP